MQRPSKRGWKKETKNPQKHTLVDPMAAYAQCIKLQILEKKNKSETL